MLEVLKGAAAVTLIIACGIVPPWDVPENAVQGGGTETAVQVYVEDAIEADRGENGAETMEYLGMFEATAYEWTGNPCANGEYPTEGYTVACNSLPLGTTVYIEGIGYRVVEDRGADWHGDNWIDLYMGDEAACIEWGVREIEVYVVK